MCLRDTEREGGRKERESRKAGGRKGMDMHLFYSDITQMSGMAKKFQFLVNFSRSLKAHKRGHAYILKGLI